MKRRGVISVVAPVCLAQITLCGAHAGSSFPLPRADVGVLQRVACRPVQPYRAIHALRGASNELRQCLGCQSTFTAINRPAGARCRSGAHCARQYVGTQTIADPTGLWGGDKGVTIPWFRVTGPVVWGAQRVPLKDRSKSH